jgi:hypothetical protein
VQAFHVAVIGVAPMLWTCTPFEASGVAQGAGPNDASTSNGADVANGKEPIGFIQSTAVESNASSTGKVVLHDPVSAHHAIIVALDFTGSSSLSSVTDDSGDTFQTVLGPISDSFDHSLYVAAAFDVAAAATPPTIAVALAKPADVLEIYVHEYAGLAFMSALDQRSGGDGSTAQMKSPDVVTTSPNELIFGFGVTASGKAQPGPNFTGRSSFNGNITEDILGAPIGTYSATATATNSWIMTITTFRGN